MTSRSPRGTCYFWVGQNEAGGPREPLETIRGAAAAAIDDGSAAAKVAALAG